MPGLENALKRALGCAPSTAPHGPVRPFRLLPEQLSALAEVRHERATAHHRKTDGADKTIL